MGKLERRIAPLGFLLSALLFVVAAVLPAWRGKPINAVFLPVSLIFLVIGIALWRKTGTDGPQA